MTKANECTCPSGDGSLRHPCPAHPASVELAGVAANLTFINGRPAMCGCQVEYSSGGGEYSDVIYVTLCAKHSGSAILDLVATNRIALTPEYEGQWHADLYLDREIPLAKAEGATPAEAVLALMSAERIDPEQESVEQAGGDERAAFEAWLAQAMSKKFEPEFDLAKYEDSGEYRYSPAAAYWKAWQARAALAQPSPASDLDPLNLAPHAEAFNEAPAEALKPEQAEAERPVVIARLYRSNDLTMTPFAEVQKPLPMPRSDGTLTVEPLMTVAQHERIVEARWNRAMDLLLDHVSRISEKFKAERDAALSRVAELEKQEPVAHLRASDLERLNQPGIAGSAGSLWNGPREGFVPLYAAPVAQAGQVPTGWYCDAPSQVEAVIIDIRGMWGEDDCPTYEDVAAALRRLLAAAPGKEGV
ncbi:hypothetical protein GHV54_21375 [Pseudomonas aeruginosa]|nr:hypothetical protein [Pseudomonas aeruginosa]MBG6549573.1 hypothetical protein [Pseudomonas aeruginosa]